MENFTVNRDKKTFVFDDGEELPIPKDKVKQVLRSPYAKDLKEQEKAKLRKYSEASFIPALSAGREAAEEEFFGSPAQTFMNYLSSGIKGISAGKGQEKLGYVDRLLDNFYALQEAHGEHLSEQEQKHPVATGIGKAVGMIGELGILGKAPASLALPIMGAAHSQTSFLEPAEKVGETAKDVVIGHILDKFFGGGAKIAGHRQTIRSIEEMVPQVEARNITETQRAAAATIADQARFAQETQAVQQAEKNYAISQAAENTKYLTDSSHSMDRIAKTMGSTPVDASLLGVEDFIENEIGRSATPVGKEAKDTTSFLRSVFKPDAQGKLTADQFKKGMSSLDAAIVGSEGVERQFLTDFRQSVLKKLPDQLSEAYVQNKWIPRILSKVGNLEEKILDQFEKMGVEKGNNRKFYEKMTMSDVFSKSKNIAQDSAKEALDSLVQKYGSLEKAIQSSNFADELSEAMQNSSRAQKIFASYDTAFRRHTRDALLLGEPFDIRVALKDEFDTVAQSINKKSKQYLLDIQNDLLTKEGVTSSAISKTPASPAIPPKPQMPPIKPAQQIAPNLAPIPQVPAPQGIYQRIGAGLENLDFGRTARRYGGTRGLGIGALAHLAHIPVAATTAGLAAGTAALRGITSPGRVGTLVRQGMEYGSRGIYRAIEDLASRYPSYHDGILDDPMERRSLVREIEDNQEISLEQKALVQSKINRGRPIESRLE
jgi:hypothetical protein